MSTVLTLCATGLALGVVHVLTGPDHLSAIATLSVNVGNHRAFWHGVRWGVGHSIGLVVVGSVFITLENLHYNHNNTDTNRDDSGGDESSSSSSSNSSRVIEVPGTVQNLADCVIGIMMLGLGFYNLYWASRNRREKKKQGSRKRNHRHGHGHCHHIHCHHEHEQDHDEERNKGHLSCDSLTATTVTISNYGDRPNALEDKNDTDNNHNDEENNSSRIDSPMGIIGKEDDDPRPAGAGGVVSKKFLSLCIGIFHGVAGPGGVLGVVPAVRLHNVWHSVAYLGSFCASSITTMGCFAALYGSLSAKWTHENDNLAYAMEVFSASLSVLVGCTWLVLLYVGILDDVFS